MELEKLKQAVNEKFKLDIETKTRQRNFTDAKKVFSKLAYESGATFDAIGKQINNSHCNILHHVNSVNSISEDYKRKHDELAQELNLTFATHFFNPNQEKIKKEIQKTTNNKTLERIKTITDVISAWDTETVQEFKQTRLDPFNALLKTRVKPKTIKEVKGALLNNRVKNPVLC